MKITKIILNNFQLFAEESIELQQINAIIGTNKDVPNNAGNGSGKTTIAMSSILFCLYGKVDGKNIADLLRLKQKKSSVSIEIIHGDKTILITRHIPSSLFIYEDGKEIEGNTIAIKEEYINNLFGDYEHFRMFRTIDTEQGINLLSLGGTTLRKTLMSFIDEECSVWRQKVLNLKNEREKLSKDLRPYKYYLSDRKLEALKNLAEKREQKYLEEKAELDDLKQQIANLNSEVKTANIKIETSDEKVKHNNNKILETKEKINSLTNKILIPFIEEKIEVIDYNNMIIENEINLENIQKEIEKTEVEEDYYDSQSQETHLEIIGAKKDVLTIDNEITVLNNRINQTKNLSGEKCDKCGAKITEESKEVFIEEINTGLEEKINSKKKIIKNIEELEIKYKKEIDSYNTENAKKSKLTADKQKLEKIAKQLIENKNKQEVMLKENENRLNIYNKDIEFFKQQIDNENKNIAEYEKENSVLSAEISEGIKFASQMDIEVRKSDEIIGIKNNELKFMETKLNRCKLYLTKYLEADKFKQYKYSKSDIEVCSEAVKTIDGFSSWYIEDWLKQLEIIINDMLRNINLNVSFLTTKDFLEINDAGNIYKYGQLSSGQKTFLNAIFKLAILLHRGENDGIILCDEGLNTMDVINLQKFIEVCNGLNFQLIFIYQNCPEIENVNYIRVIRENNESKVRRG